MKKETSCFRDIVGVPPKNRRFFMCPALRSAPSNAEVASGPVILEYIKELVEKTIRLIDTNSQYLRISVVVI
ncbi:hypothetical protein [Pontibacter anaerobius]|uniref:Uncharacterized protein n=1 Tax=Pontibacter anaerobius TaxID=2993940 RepID=A0ABT3RCA5_9BACT|nr:hypothetical protein [Pontibacter anaerobius]MCX2739496.1 hypothetical protein [Pontibacter anaerobius]